MLVEGTVNADRNANSVNICKSFENHKKYIQTLTSSMLLQDRESLGLDDHLEILCDIIGQILTMGSRNSLSHLLDGQLKLGNGRDVLLTKTCLHDAP